MNRQRCVDNIQDRIDGVYNDLKAFIYIRKNNLQHKNEDIGGGNIVVGLSIFSAFNFLAKCYDCTERPDQFNSNGWANNETETFVQFVRFLRTGGIDLGLPDDDEVSRVVWKGFRNYLAHRLTVEVGKSLITFTFEPDTSGSIMEILEKAKKHSAFEGDANPLYWLDHPPPSHPDL